MNFINVQWPSRKFVSILDVLRSISPINQVYLLVGLSLFLQYFLNALVYYQFIPDFFGHSLNGITKNSTYLIPGFLALISAGFFTGRAGILKILRPYKVFPLNPFWWLFSLGIIIVILWLSLHLNNLLYQQELLSYTVKFPPWQSIASSAPLFIQVALSDELFWIGFIYPRLVASGHTPLKASLLMGIFWGIQYVPYVYTQFFVGPGLSVSSLVFGWFALSPIYMWLYHRTGSAIIIVFFNVCMQFSFSALPTLPLIVGDNTVVAMANLVTLLVGLFIWKYFPGTNHSNSY